MLAAALLAGAALLAPRARADGGAPPAILFLQADRSEDSWARELEAALDEASSSTVHLVLRCGVPRDARTLDSCLAAFRPRLTVAVRPPEEAVAAELRAKGAAFRIVPASAREAAREVLARAPDAAAPAPSPAARSAAEKKVAAAHFDVGDDAGAKAALLRALAAVPDDFDALEPLYRLEFRGVWLRDAETYADRAAGIEGLSDARRSTALEARGRTRALLGDDDAGERDLREALRLRPDDGETAYRLAQLLRERPKEALVFAERAVTLAASEGRRADAARLAVLIRFDLGDADEARKALKALHGAPRPIGSELDVLQTDVQVAGGRPPEARAAARLAEEAAAASPLWERPAAERLCASLWHALKDDRKELASLKRALTLAPNDVYTLEAMVELKRARPDGGLDFSAPASSAPPAESAWTERALNRALTGDPEDLDALSRLIELERGRGNVPGELRAAARFLDAARDASPWRQPAAYRYITKVWMGLGDDNDVQIALGLARDLDRRSLEFEELSRTARRPDDRGVIYAANRVAAHVAVAAARAELGDAAGAERDADLALAEDPAAPPALAFLARFELGRGRPQEALAYSRRLDAASRAAPPAERADADRLRAEIELALGDEAAAAESLESTLTLFPDDLQSLGLLIDVDSRAGNTARALELAGRLIQAVRTAPPARRAAALAQEARLRLELKDEPGAEKSLESALALDPASSSALQLMAELHLAKSEAKEALAYADRLAAATARASPAARAQALRLRARMQLASGDIPAARRSLEEALALDGSRAALSAQIQFELAHERPLGAAVYSDRLMAADETASPAQKASDERQRAQIQLELKKPGEAADSLRRALALDPSDRGTQRLLINLEQSRGRTREALAGANSLVALSSAAPAVERADAFCRRARLRLESGDVSGSDEDFKAALASSPEDVASLWMLMSASSARPREAMDLVERHRPSSAGLQAPWRALRGMANALGGDAEAARTDFDAAVAADSATVCFGEVSRENRDRFDPIFFDSCLRAFPSDAALYSDRGVARYRAGKTDAAIADFREAAARAPDLLEARLSLATALAAAGRRDEAAKETDLALARAGTRHDPVVRQLESLKESLRAR